MLPIERKVGRILRYSYLWHWQYLEGREEGDKDSPALVLAASKARSQTFQPMFGLNPSRTWCCFVRRGPSFFAVVRRVV